MPWKVSLIESTIIIETVWHICFNCWPERPKLFYHIQSLCKYSHSKWIRLQVSSINSWKRIEYCGYWCPGAKAPGHQYPQPSYDIHCIGTVLYQNSISIVNNMQTYDYYYCAVLWCVNKLSILCPDGRIHLFAHYTTQSSSLCRPIWRYWTTKLLFRYILSRVCV